MNPEKILTVRLNKTFVGYLEQNLQGKFVFTYDKNAKVPLSISLPIRKEPYEDKDCRGFFEGLLPEGEQTRIEIGKKYGVNPKNEFSLLKVIGYDCAGAISFTEYEENPKSYKNEFITIKGNKFTDETLEQFINELPKKPLLTNYDGLRLSLAGVQDKMAILLLDNVVALPNVNIPTTHIIKPAIKDIEYSIENEYLCLQLARMMGLNVCKAEIRKTENLKYLLIKRYDREIDGNKVRRIHQEDFCQAKNITSAFKYQREGGVTINDCFDLLKKTKTPIPNMLELINRIIFNYLIGNADAHGKNFSLLYTDTGITFAPAYDILCTAIYPELTKQMAMKLGGYYEPNKIYPRHWKRMSEEVGISYTKVRSIILKQAELIPGYLMALIDYSTANAGKKMLDFVSQNCKETIRRFSCEE